MRYKSPLSRHDHRVPQEVLVLIKIIETQHVSVMDAMLVTFVGTQALAEMLDIQDVSTHTKKKNMTVHTSTKCLVFG